MKQAANEVSEDLPLFIDSMTEILLQKYSDNTMQLLTLLRMYLIA